MTMKRKNYVIGNKLLSSLLLILIGIMFIILKGEVISIALSIIGIGLIISAIMDYTKKRVTPAIIELIMGIIVIVFGWTLLSAAIIILAALILIYGIFQLYTILQYKRKSLIYFIEPILTIIVALCLLFNKGGTINFVFIISGICLIADGLISLAYTLKSK